MRDHIEDLVGQNKKLEGKVKNLTAEVNSYSIR